MSADMELQGALWPRALTAAELLERYGTPEAAWANWVAPSPHWYSGSQEGTSE